MPTPIRTASQYQLLEDDEPSAVEVVNPDGQAQVVLLCDHASNRIPRRLGTLGLTEAQLQTHIAWDPGAAMVARELANLIDAPLVLSGYSRLVIDCNRQPTREDLIPDHSDNVQIPGNAKLTQQERESRLLALVEPYQLAIRDLLDTRRQYATSLISVHSFTPAMQGEERPWTIGVCYGTDTRLAKLMLRELYDSVTGIVGDNEPYSIEDDVDYTLPLHGAGRSLPHLMLEIRQDLITTPRQTENWARTVANAWNQISPVAQQLARQL